MGHRLVEALPQRDRRGPYPDLGIVVAPVDRLARAVFGLSETERGAYVVAVRPEGPGMLAGVHPGDLVHAVDDRAVSSAGGFRAAAYRLRPGGSCRLTVLREGQTVELPVVVGSTPRRVQFRVVRNDQVNAWTNGRSEIAITTGMLRFIESDDELATILGHELAHVTGKHVGRRLGTGVISSIAGVALGAVAEVAAPGSGSVVMNAASRMAGAAFSRNFEREADYRGLLHARRAGYDVAAGLSVWERFGTEIPGSLAQQYLSTHPASPERMVRVRKISASLAEDGLDATIARYEGTEAVVSNHAVEADAEGALAAQPSDTR
jgi:hypothetical protein